MCELVGCHLTECALNALNAECNSKIKFWHRMRAPQKWNKCISKIKSWYRIYASHKIHLSQSKHNLHRLAIFPQEKGHPEYYQDLIIRPRLACLGENLLKELTYTDTFNWLKKDNHPFKGISETCQFSVFTPFPIDFVLHFYVVLAWKSHNNAPRGPFLKLSSKG